MSGIKRWFYSELHNEIMQEDHGKYVLHYDHEAIVDSMAEALVKLDGACLASEQEVARLRAEADSLRKDAERYRWLQKQTPYRFGKIQAACVIDAVDTLYFMSEEFDKQVDAAMGASA